MVSYQRNNMNAMTMSRPNKYNEEIFYVIWVITITFFHPRNTNTCVRWATKNNNINRYQEYMSMMTLKEMRCNLLKDLKVSLKPSYAFNVMWLHYKLFSNGMVFHWVFFVGSKLNMDYIIQGVFWIICRLIHTNWNNDKE